MTVTESSPTLRSCGPRRQRRQRDDGIMVQGALIWNTGTLLGVEGTFVANISTRFSGDRADRRISAIPKDIYFIILLPSAPRAATSCDRRDFNDAVAVATLYPSWRARGQAAEALRYD